MRRVVRILLERLARLAPPAVLAIASVLLVIIMSVSYLIRLDFRYSDEPRGSLDQRRSSLRLLPARFDAPLRASGGSLAREASVEQMVEMVDMLMYSAKTSGKNRLVKRVIRDTA